MKSGRTSAGAQAAQRHTAADPGEDDVFDAAIVRAGMCYLMAGEGRRMYAGS